MATAAQAEHSFQDTLGLLRDLLKRDLDKGMRDDPMTVRIQEQIDRLDPPKHEREPGPTEKVQRARAEAAKEEGGEVKGGRRAEYSSHSKKE